VYQSLPFGQSSQITSSKKVRDSGQYHLQFSFFEILQLSQSMYSSSPPTVRTFALEHEPSITDECDPMSQVVDPVTHQQLSSIRTALEHESTLFFYTDGFLANAGTCDMSMGCFIIFHF
jgi:hypothetical protein